MTASFNERIIEEFRANEGRVGGLLAGTPMMLVHHIGAKSGVTRVTPLTYAAQGDGRYVIVASNGGSPTHPSWYFNLRANPDRRGAGERDGDHDRAGAARLRPCRTVDGAARDVAVPP